MTEIKTTKIPRRQKCVDKDHPYIGGAKDIVDDTLGKPQSEVNQDRIEDIAAEVQRAQGAESTLDGKITLEKQRAEGVESGLNNRLGTVEQLAEISIGGGDAQIATGADFTNPDATKRAKVTTVGAIIDGLNDGVYDVSKRNPTAGPNSDGKFTLDYILSNADTLIPTGWRHGGMTISFVHTYDNKYMQYRLMADEFTTDTDLWSAMYIKKSYIPSDDLEVVDDVGNMLVVMKNGHLKTKNFNSEKSPIIDSGVIGDFCVVDENKKPIVSILNGDIKTKNFNSSKVKISTGASDFGDFELKDSNNNILFTVINGNIRTKNFDSAKRAKKPYSVANIHFKVEVNVNMLKDTPSTLDLTDSLDGYTEGGIFKKYTDEGVLMLPESYTNDGAPTRLVIGCHGAGGGVSDHDSQTESSRYYKYLVANGYAVMDMSGMPSDWVETWWEDYDDFGLPEEKKDFVKVNNMGCPLAIECYIKGYEWVIENYNICTDGVFVAGASMGGLTATNLVLSCRIPVLAQAGFAPVLDTYNQPFLHSWTNGVAKYTLGKLYNFAVENNDFIYSSEKVCGFNPIINGMQTYSSDGRITSAGIYDFTTKKLNNNDVVEYKSYPCPLKIWHCENDDVVNISVSERQINAIKNCGGIAWLRKFPSGGHAPDEAGQVIQNPTGNTTLKGASVGAIRPMAEELLLFFNRFKK